VTGAFCLTCLEAGPDLTISAPPPELRAGIVADLAFTCGRCQRRWAWEARWTAGGWAYSLVATRRPGGPPAAPPAPC